MERETFISRFGAMAAVAGSAIGLGNIWKFPYVAAQNGGAAFLIIYTVITLSISIPVLLAEMTIGRKGQGDVWISVRRITQSKGWLVIPVFALLAAFFLLAFYNVVSGWSLEYVGQALINGFKGADEGMMARHFSEYINSGTRPIICVWIFLLMNCLVLFFGVTKGIERCGKIMIPALFLMLIFIAVASIPLSGWKEGVAFLLKPDWSKVTGETILAALGQSFFSLSIGSAAMMTYGSYVDKKGNLFSIVMVVAFASILIAILAGMAIFPAVFTYGVELTSGPALVFVTLPPLFAKMHAGYLIGLTFFVLLFFAAITSSLSVLEGLVAFVSDRLGVSRFKALAGMLVVFGVASSLVALSQVETSSLRVFGHDLFDCADILTSDFLMPAGGIFMALFVGWHMDRNDVRHEMTTAGTYGKRYYRFAMIMLRYVCPPAIFVLWYFLI